MQITIDCLPFATNILCFLFLNGNSIKNFVRNFLCQCQKREHTLHQASSEILTQLLGSLTWCAHSFIIFIYMHPIIQSTIFSYCFVASFHLWFHISIRVFAPISNAAHPLHVQLINYWLSRCASYGCFIIIIFFFASSTAQTVSILCTIKFLRNDSVKMLEFKVGKPNEKMKKRSGFVVVVCTSHSIFGTQQNLHRYFMLNRHIEMWRDFLLHWFATKDSHWKGKKIAYETKWIS